MTLRRAGMFAPFLLAGCFDGPRALDQESMPVAPDRVGFSIREYRVGQWVAYETREGRDIWTEKKAVVGKEGDALWIELTQKSGGPPRITALLVEPSGKVQRAFYGDPGRDGVAMPSVPDRGEKEGDRPRLDTKESEEELHAAGRTFHCRKIESAARHSDGAVRRLTTWYSDEVPFATSYEGKRYGGLVKLEGTTTRKILTGFGTDAKPELQHP